MDNDEVKFLRGLAKSQIFSGVDGKQQARPEALYTWAMQIRANGTLMAPVSFNATFSKRCAERCSSGGYYQVASVANDAPGTGLFWSELPRELGGVESLSSIIEKEAYFTVSYDITKYLIWTNEK